MQYNMFHLYYNIFFLFSISKKVYQIYFFYVISSQSFKIEVYVLYFISYYSYKNQNYMNVCCLLFHFLNIIFSLFSKFHLVDSRKTTSFGLPLRQTRMMVIAHVLCADLHEMTPKFGTMCGCPMQAPMQHLGHFGHRTNIASRPGSVSGSFHWQNPSKCIECRKSMRIGMHDVHGHPIV